MLSFKPIKPLLQTGTNAASRWFSYIGLGIGVLLLLASVQMFVNIQQLMKEGSIRKNGFDFISITKKVTNETMGQPEKNVFTDKEVEELKSKPFVTDVAPLQSNLFRVQLSAGNILPFKTDLFVESIEDEFLDTVPPTFHWVEGQLKVPIIVSSDYLEMFNVFAPSQGLSQVSKETAMNIPVVLSVSGKGQRLDLYGSVVAFSDRLNTVIVPKSFLDWANRNYGETPTQGYSRLYIKTTDANNPELLSFLDQKGYVTNRDKTKMGRTKQVMEGIFTGLGVFGLLVVVMALMLFSFYLQLVIARSKENLQLLLLIGYSPLWLSKNVSQRFIPVYVSIVLVALSFTQFMQWAFHHFAMYDREELHTTVHWSVIVLAIVLIALSIITNYRLVRRLLYKLF
ncbi:hypothetical protein [Flavisolibacter ginsenosidimutans]|uniref:FtsX-like permease family protein n=1 Tax=Flavisolibacter ginsenosidimutans TaxID=661481 RepID=A0A5B8UIR2_9BACT|nr:hypothetical protein [Flavisolibacter ginsenosidimutans]QEC56554.1 hypothetical protein FSB75_11835 [Flavisolibacter ginsenosidimutans]